MRYIPPSRLSEPRIDSHCSLHETSRRTGGVRWPAWYLQLTVVGGILLAIMNTKHSGSGRSEWTAALLSIPLRSDARLKDTIGNSPLVALDDMPMSIFGIERISAMNGSTSWRDSAADGFAPSDYVIVSLPYSETRDEHMPLIAQGPRICSLALDGTRITDAGLRHLRGMAQLETLSLGETEITEAGVRILGDVRSLRSLDLRRTRLSGAALAPLASLRRLESLNLSGTPVDGPGLKHLNKLERLQALILDDTALNDSDVEALLAIKSLHVLHIRGTCISDDGIARLAALPELKICVTDRGSLSRHELGALRDRAGE